MSYVINNYNGDQLTVLNDGTINVTSTSLGLVGRNYVGYGEVQNENFVYLLENFANDAPPSRPLTGQLWFDTGTEEVSVNLLKVFDGTNWVAAGAVLVAETSPVAPNAGALWFRPSVEALYVWSGTAWSHIGPEFAEGFGLTRAKSTTVRDLAGVQKPVIFLTVNEIVVAIVSSQSFTIAIEDKPTGFNGSIYSGINLPESFRVVSNLTGLADRATKLENSRAINGVGFDGTADITVEATTPFNLYRGSYLVGGTFNGSADVTLAVDATPENQIGKVVARNAFGGFSAGLITADLAGDVTGNITATTGYSSFAEIRVPKIEGDTFSGNAATSSKFITSRNINGVAFDGSKNITITAAADTLTGTSINSIVTDSSLTSLGTLTSLNIASTGSLKFGSSNLIVSMPQSGGFSPLITTSTGKMRFVVGSSLSGASLVTAEEAVAQGATDTTVGAFAPQSNLNLNLGLSSKKWKTIYADNFLGRATTATDADYANDIRGGQKGSVLYQEGVNNTAMLPIGTLGQILKVGASGIPDWQDPDRGVLNSGEFIVGGNFDGTNSITWDIDATSDNVSNKIISRDASGNFSAGTITATLNGTASEVSHTLTRGSYLTGSNFNGGAATTWAVDAASTNNANKVVARDSNGSFEANTVKAALDGNAKTATKLATPRTINGVLFDGTADIEIPSSIKAWVKFRGSSGAILKSLNITSVVKTGTGRYTINIQPGMFSNNQYAIAGSASNADHVLSTAEDFVGGSSTPVTLFVSTVDTSTNAPADSAEVSVMMIGSQYIPGELDIIESIGQTQYLTVGSYNWTVPAGVDYISVAAVGGGGGGGSCVSNYGGSGGGGGGCAYANDIPVSPGEVLTVVVGAGGSASQAGGDTMIRRNSTIIIKALGGTGGNSNGSQAAGGSFYHNDSLIDGTFSGWLGGYGGVSYGGTGQAGGNGTGLGYIGAAGGGSGGHTGGGTEQDGGNGAVGATGGGLGANNTRHSGAGGGGGALSRGYGGSAGVIGDGSLGGNGGKYGGGGGGGSHGGGSGGQGAAGGLRIIWGSYRQYPGTSTEDL